MGERCSFEDQDAQRHRSFDISTVPVRSQNENNNTSSYAFYMSTKHCENNERTLRQEIRDCAKANRQMELHPPLFGATQGLLSCPDLQHGHQTTAQLNLDSPYSSGWPSPTTDWRDSRRLSRSQPPTPVSLSDRFRIRFRKRRRWEPSAPSISGMRLPIENPQSPGVKDARRRGPKATQIYKSSDDDGALGVDEAEAPAQGVITPLVMAGVLVAVEDLDRLTAHAKQAGDKSGQQ